MFLPKIRIVGKKATTKAYRELKVFEKNIRDNPDMKKIRQSRLSSFYALESLLIYHDDLKNEKIKKDMCKRKKS